MLGIDEQLFENLAPKKLMHILENTAELPHPPATTWKGLDCPAAIRWLTTVAILLVLLFNTLLPQVEILKGSQDSLCGGNLNFVYTIDGMGAVRWSSTGNDPPLTGLKWRPPTKESNARLQYATRMVEALLADKIDDNHTLCGMESSSLAIASGNATIPNIACWTADFNAPLFQGQYATVAAAKGSGDDTVALANPACIDVLDKPGRLAYLFWDLYADAVNAGGSTFGSQQDGCSQACSRYRPVCENGTCVTPTCAHALKYCHDATFKGLRARQACPVTCGCRDFSSRLLLTGPGLGCGPVCVQTNEYKHVLAEASCNDANQTKLDMYTTDFRTAVGTAGWPNAINTRAMLAIEEIERYGCAAGLHSDSLCSDHGPHGVPVKPFTLLCPISCGCYDKPKHQVPSTCFQSCKHRRRRS